MRVGQNPNRQEKAEALPEMVAAVITHLPHMEGYHRERLEIIQICLRSMRQNAGMRLAFMVWDNGSCAELREWLQNVFRPEFLILAPNVGKDGARASMVNMLQVGTVVCFSDDDMLFYPGWLKPQLELLQGWPHVGAVSGYPVRTQFRWGTDTTLAWAEEYAKVEYGRFIPEEWERDFCDSVGREWNFHVTYTKKDRDALITFNGQQAYGTAHHCQLVAYAERIGPFCTNDGWSISDEKVFDQMVDRAGFLRLTTTERLCRHMGNVMDGKLRGEVKDLGFRI